MRNTVRLLIYSLLHQLEKQQSLRNKSINNNTKSNLQGSEWKYFQERLCSEEKLLKRGGSRQTGGERDEVTVLLLKSDSRADRLERIETQRCSFKLFRSTPGQRPLRHVTSQRGCVPNQTLSSLPAVGFPKNPVLEFGLQSLVIMLLKNTSVYFSKCVMTSK